MSILILHHLYARAGEMHRKPGDEESMGGRSAPKTQRQWPKPEQQKGLVKVHHSPQARAFSKSTARLHEKC